MQLLSNFIFIALVVQVISLFILGCVLGTTALKNAAKQFASRFGRRTSDSGHGH